MESIVKQRGHEIIMLDDYIKAYESAKYAYDKLYLDKYNTIHILDLFDNFMNDYWKKHERESYTMEIILTDTEKKAYKYNPKALSNRIYGTPDYWQVIMRCNEYEHPAEMDFIKPVMFPKPEALRTLFQAFERIKKGIGDEWLDMKDINLNDVL